MSININLVSDTNQLTPRKSRANKLRYLSFIALFFVAFLSLLLFLINIKLSVNGVKKQQSLAMQDFSSFDKTSSKVFLRNARLNDIAFILDTRKKYNIIGSKIISLIPNEVKVTAFKLDKNGVALTLTSASLLELDAFFNKFLDLTGSNKVSNISLDSLEATQNGFTMSLKANVL